MAAMERAPLKTGLRRGLAHPGLLGCARRCRRYGARGTRFKHGSESRLSCHVHSDSRPSAAVPRPTVPAAGCGSAPQVESKQQWTGSPLCWPTGAPRFRLPGPSPLAAWAACYRPRAGAGHVHVGTVTARQLPSAPLCRLAGPGCCTRPPAHRHLPMPERLAATAAVARRKGQ